MNGSRQHAAGSRQSGPRMASAIAVGALSVGMFLLLNAVGCSERSSPAASKAVVMTSTNDVAAATHDQAAKANDRPAATVATDPKTDPQPVAVVEPVSAEAKSEPKAQPESQPQPAKQPESPPVDAKKPTRDISFDTIKFDMKKEDPFEQKMLTPTVKKLVNNKIRIRGYILPSFQQAGITQFVLVRDNLECCFGPGAALYDCVVVQMNEGKSTDFTTRPIAVEGVFSLDELRDADGKCLAIYHLQGDKVQ
jgi:hypothetical protein